MSRVATVWRSGASRNDVEGGVRSKVLAQGRQLNEAV